MSLLSPENTAPDALPAHPSGAVLDVTVPVGVPVPLVEVPPVEVPPVEVPLHEQTRPVITEVVLPDGQVVTPEEAKARDEAQANLPARNVFDDEGAESAVFHVVDKGGKYRTESIWFGVLSEELSETVEEMPLTLSEMTGIEVKGLGEVDKALESMPYDKQLAVKRYLSDLYKRVRLEDGLVRRWTFQGRSGQVRPVDATAIEKLPPDVKQGLSQAIINHVLSGQVEFDFFPASSL